MEISNVFLALIPVTWGVVQAVKKVGLKSRWAPLTSLAVGVVLAFILGGDSLSQVILGGLVVGLSAAGLYSGVKATV